MELLTRLTKMLYAFLHIVPLARVNAEKVPRFCFPDSGIKKA